MTVLLGAPWISQGRIYPFRFARHLINTTSSAIAGIVVMMYSRGFHSPASIRTTAIRQPHPTGTRKGRISDSVRLLRFGQSQRINN